MIEGREDLARFQRTYFEQRDKATMRRPAGRYVLRHVDELVRALDLRPGQRILEVGCGQGRYLIPLAARGLQVEGLDLSPVLLDRLRAAAGDAGDGLRLHAGDLVDPRPDWVGAFDAVVGFFVLHHLHDVPACLHNLATWVKPGGQLGFLEPNPWNPLFHIQICCTPGMSYRGERSLLQMTPGRVLGALEDCGMADTRVERFGFFPPFLANRPSLGPLETLLERVPLWRGLLPFQLFLAARP